MELNVNSTFSLNNGIAMPVFGLGVFKASQEQAAAAVCCALKMGYRMADTARAYSNEQGVGEGIRQSGVPRDQIFVTTKLWKTDYQDAASGLKNSLRRLGLDYVDLLLLHWPFKGYGEAWMQLEELQRQGLCRSIGVSNFKIHHLKELAQGGATVTPQVNQTEIHPVNTEEELCNYCRQNGIQVEAYSPLGGEGRLLLDDPRLVGMREHYRRTPSQILLRWDIQRGIIAIPKSVHEERIRENMGLFDFDLSQGDLQTISDMNSNDRRNYDPDRIDERPSWMEPKFSD
ncbi:MAG: aldo/keto reductase [Succinivibrio sp.]|jgi:diketogulonate reductase-like aldo/keto reductase|nr:aldo/keto reductase [Succinivibrio sp.]